MRHILAVFAFATAPLMGCTVLDVVPKVPYINPAPKPVTPPLAYQFHIKTMQDTRKTSDDENRNIYAFSQPFFVKAVRENTPNSLFVKEKAYIHATLTDFVTTRFEGDFALTLSLDAWVEDAYGRILVTKATYPCARTYHKGFYADELAKSILKSENIADSALSKRIFENLVRTCAKKMTSDLYARILYTPQNRKEEK